MSGRVDQRAERAASAGKEDLGRFVHDPSPRVIKALLTNRNLSEQEVLIIASRKNLPGDLLESIAKDRRWAASYPLRLALAKNPKTPMFTALSLARYLRLFDLADTARSHFLPLVYRHKLEAIIIEKIPTMALGLKKSLAKTVVGNVLLTMLRDQDPEVVQACLNNPHLLESHLFKVITRHDTVPGTIRMIAEHAAWSNRYTVRLALARNSHAPLARCIRFFEDMKIRDLRDLYEDPTAPTGMKPYIHREIMERGEEVEREAEREKEVYEIDEEDGAAEPERDDAEEGGRAGTCEA